MTSTNNQGRDRDPAPNIILSPKAVDRASTHLHAVWQRTKRTRTEGVYSWLQRMALAALRNNERDEEGHHKLTGMRFVFDTTSAGSVVLKTVFKVSHELDER